MDIKKQLNEFKQIVKAPPIPNPYDEKEYANDSLSDKEVEELFEKVVDPKIQSAADDDRDGVFIYQSEVDMSQEVLLKWLKFFYAPLGYRLSKFGSNQVSIRLR
jgi:hypothetical protein